MVTLPSAILNIIERRILFFSVSLRSDRQDIRGGSVNRMGAGEVETCEVHCLSQNRWFEGSNCGDLLNPAGAPDLLRSYDKATYESPLKAKLIF